MDAIQKELLEQVAGLHEMPAGAYNIRANGEAVARNTTAHIDIVTKTDKSGIDIVIKPGTKKESVHIPVVLSQSGLTEMVYNDFHVGDDCDVTIVAGCGIHNSGDQMSKHDGIHTFYIGKNSHVKYVEKHYGSGEGTVAAQSTNVAERRAPPNMTNNFTGKRFFRPLTAEQIVLQFRHIGLANICVLVDETPLSCRPRLKLLI